MEFRILGPIEATHDGRLARVGSAKEGRLLALLLAQAGSVLNYGYLDRPNASGQWEARVLKARLGELTTDFTDDTDAKTLKR